MARRGYVMIMALMRTAPIPIAHRPVYKGNCEILVSYGTGHPERRPWIEKHIAKGGRFIGLDLGYWDREEPDAGMRTMIDGDHCTKFLRPEPGDRFAATGIQMREHFDPDGPIMLVAKGMQARRVTGDGPLSWESQAIARIRAELPGRRIIYRRKRTSDGVPSGVECAPDTPISEALRGVSLVVCQHSNVAVDACIAGIPAVCEYGAASAIYGNDLCNPKAPSKAERLAFLQSLAYWNWRPSEAAACWAYHLNRIKYG